MSTTTTRLSRRQRAILDYCISSLARQGFPPSIREIGNAVALSSSSTVHSHLMALERKGYILRNKCKPRNLTVLRDPDAQPLTFEFEADRLRRELADAQAEVSHLLAEVERLRGVCGGYVEGCPQGEVAGG